MSTTIAVIADVHGNSRALLSVLAEIDQHPGVERIYCIGDMVGIGYETNEVLRILFSRKDVSFVVGNHEEELMAIFEGRNGESRGGEKLHHEWLAKRFDQRLLPKLKAIPKEIAAEYEGHKILFTHYHLDSEQQFLSIEAEPTIEKLDQLYRESPFDLVCFGHHHPVHHFSSAHRTYLNPGSLGCYDKPSARYAIVELTAREINVALKQAPYDNQDFLLGYERLDVPEKEFILNVFHGNQTSNK
ncbi:metallophosphoesterase family protein [Planococcus maitriensis]|uniref:Metallophosphoesterase n=1 Tax=Planococcus maitriensis TaxID=221799 RepID=A0A365K8N3_9BACL|nr:metallophosphoesterase family protein [Planococcus maitriensis]RAZ69163.1 metallophosphoesterase [Planococcus maitriensis]